MADLLIPPEIIMLCILGGLLLITGLLYLIRQCMRDRQQSMTGSSDSQFSDDVSTHKSIPLGSVAGVWVPPTSVQLFSRAEGRQSPVIEITPAIDDPHAFIVTPSPELAGSPFFMSMDEKDGKDSKKMEAVPKQTTQSTATTKPSKSPSPPKPTTAKKEATTPARKEATTAKTEATTPATSKSAAEKKVVSKPPAGKKEISQKVTVRNITRVRPYTANNASK